MAQTRCLFSRTAQSGGVKGAKPELKASADKFTAIAFQGQDTPLASKRDVHVATKEQKVKMLSLEGPCASVACVVVWGLHPLKPQNPAYAVGKTGEMPMRTPHTTL